MGLDTLAAAIGEDSGTIEDVYEPYLIKKGFINRTPRGRVVTELGYHHLGVVPEGGQYVIISKKSKDVNIMAMKNAVEVVVDGRVYKISGYESQEYMHQIAVYINEKMTQCHNTENYRKQSSDQRQLMLSMNLADDYFKAKNQAERLTAELEKRGAGVVQRPA